MLQRYRRAGGLIRRIWRIVVLFLALRLTLGLALIVIFNRDAAAWGLRATLILAVAFVVSFAVALAVRRYAPPRRVS